MTTTIILLVVFAVSIGYATFAESSSGTEYAKEIVYNAKWFELLLAFLIVNMLGSAIRYKMTYKRKFSVLLFHLSFIIILIGSGITRYFGSEGIMHLRQGETSNEITSEKSSVKVVAEYNGEKVEKMFPVVFSENGTTNFSESIEIGGKSLNIQNELYIPNSIETLEAYENGEPGIAFFVMNQNNQGQDIILTAGESIESNGVRFAFADSTIKSDIHFTMDGEQLFTKAKTPIAKMSMMENNESIIKPGSLLLTQTKTIYKTANLVFVLKKFLTNSKKSLTQFSPDMNKMGRMIKSKNAIVFDISNGELSKKMNVFSTEEEVPSPSSCMLNDVKVSISYGNIPQKLPFSITLRQFQLDRYPGSNSPSSYASEITVIDQEMKTQLPFRIYMNNILNYRGYRFFQSSYDEDEQGTILSVNHDYWGTIVTYIGYFFMLIGMILTLFNKNSHFFTVIKQSNALQQKRKASKMLFMAGLLTFSGSLLAVQTTNSKKAHLEALNSLLIQDEAQGRVEPLSTYASDLVRKITKKTTYNKLSAVEVILGMVTNPTKWQNEPVIKVAHEELANELAVAKDYVAASQLFDNKGQYKLAEKVEKACQKDPSERNQYEKELINVDERLNILNSIFSGSILTIFPIKGHENGKWNAAINFNNDPSNDPSIRSTNDGVCPMSGKTGKTNLPTSSEPNNEGMNGSMGENGMGNMGAECPVTGKTGSAGKVDESAMNGMTMKADNENTNEGSMQNMPLNAIMNSDKATSTESLLTSYFSAVLHGEETGDWSFANSALLSLKNYQFLNGGTQLPSKTKVKLEVLYNNISLFLTIAILYGLLGILLIGLHIINILKYNPKIDRYLNISIYPLILMFILYTAGLIMRWYISGHAPWSNGYEAMIFVGWGASLSGLAFAGRSPITLAITSILSAIALSVAGMSWMNPEITNLVPVLKSYWLVVHVAVITSSYGFFAMAAMMGIFNLFLMIARTEKNHIRLNESILEFSYIIELSLTIGLFMLTVGTFLGGIWANESWGRYWGWDSKETWALVSILVYSAILHLRTIPKANNLLILNTASVIGFSSVIMTFVGVNYYLSGMHSYGQGTPPPVPTGIYIVIIGLIALVVFAYNSEIKSKK